MLLQGSEKDTWDSETQSYNLPLDIVLLGKFPIKISNQTF